MAFWFALGYPLLAHLAVYYQSANLQWLALVWLLATSILGALRAGRIWAWFSLIVGAGGLFAWVYYGNGMYALYAAPILLPFAILMLFAGSLRANAIPLVTRMATLIRGEPLPEVLLAYTRRVTLLWCFVSAALTVSAVVCAIWTTPKTWSLMTNGVHYLVLGLMFVGEFFYRRFKYRHLEPWGLFEFLRRLMQTRFVHK